MTPAASQLVSWVLPAASTSVLPTNQPGDSVAAAALSPPHLDDPVPPLETSPAVRFQRPPSPNPVLPIAAVSALMCAGCDGDAGKFVADFFSNISAPGAALIGALITGLVASVVAPWMRAWSDVRFRATPAGTRRTAQADLYRTLAMLEVVEKLPEEKIRNQFLHDLVEMEKEALKKKRSQPILGRTQEIETIFGSFLEIERPSLVITGAPNSGTSTLIRAVAGEVAKLELGEPSLCPPAWKGGRLYTLRFERLMALDEYHRALMLMAILRISRDDPQHVKLVIDNRPFLAGSHTSSVMAPILDAIQRSRIGAILAMTEDHYKELTKNGGSELEAHLRPLKLSRLSEEDIGRLVMEAFTEQLSDLRMRDPKFAKLSFTFSAFASKETVFLKALNGGPQEPDKADLGKSLILTREFAVYLYRQFRKGQISSIVLNEELVNRFLKERPRESLPISNG